MLFCEFVENINFQEFSRTARLGRLVRAENAMDEFEDGMCSKDLHSELAKLTKTVCHFYLDNKLNIRLGARFDFNFKPLNLAECFMSAFRTAVEATKVIHDWSLFVELLQTIISHLRAFYGGNRLISISTRLNNEEMTGFRIERFTPKFQTSDDSVCSTVHLKLQELNLLISGYEAKKTQGTRAQINDFRSPISILAEKLSLEFSQSLRCEGSQNPSSNHGLDQSMLFSKMQRVFEYPVQLAMVSIHWKSPNELVSDATESCPHVLSSALDLMEKYLAEIADFVKHDS